MPDLYYTLDITATSDFGWFIQQDRRWTINPLGDVLLDPFVVEGYRIAGFISLASELRTFNRADEVAEYYSLDVEYFEIPGWEDSGVKVVYCQSDALGSISFWMVPDRAFVKKLTGENKAIIDIYGRHIGDVSVLQAGFRMEDLDELTNDWNL